MDIYWNENMSCQHKVKPNPMKQAGGWILTEVEAAETLK